MLRLLIAAALLLGGCKVHQTTRPTADLNTIVLHEDFKLHFTRPATWEVGISGSATGAEEGKSYKFTPVLDVSSVSVASWEWQLYTSSRCTLRLYPAFVGTLAQAATATRLTTDTLIKTQSVGDVRTAQSEVAATPGWLRGQRRVIRYQRGGRKQFVGDDAGDRKAEAIQLPWTIHELVLTSAAGRHVALRCSAHARFEDLLQSFGDALLKTAKPL